MNTTHKSSHGQWSSRLGFVLAATGSAIGLGNIWKFPYMTGVNGGAAFVLTYLICIAFIGFPILVLEWLIGRRGQKNPIYAMQEVAAQNRRSPKWRMIGLLGIVGSFLVLSFYSVIGGWAVDYIVMTATGTFSGMNGEQTGNIFSGFLANSGQLLLWHTVFIGLTIFIVAQGVSAGIEKASKWMMPALVVVLIVLVGYGVFATGKFSETASFMFSPDWSKIDGKVTLSALGHAFFTLSLGMGIMLSYGSYLGEDINLLKTARTVVILDTVIALAAGFAIFPLVFSHGLEPSSGPGLMFISLPIVFGNMAGGTVLGILFFVLLTFAALTSAMSLLEPTVEFLEEKTPLSRKLATLVAGSGVWLLGIACLLSFNHWSGFTIFGNNIFDFLDILTSKFMLPLTALATVIFAAWFMNHESITQELHLKGGTAILWNIVIRFIAPLGVAVVFAYGVYELFA